MKAEIERHPGMVRENLTDSCFPCYNVTEMNGQTRWMRQGTGAHQLEPIQFVPGMLAVPSVPPGDYEGAQSPKINGVQPGDNKGA